MRNIVKTILPNSGIESARSSRMAQVQIVLAHGNSENQEIEWIWQQAKKHSKVGDPVAIIIPKKQLIDNFIKKICEIEKIRWPEWVKNEYGNGRDYNVVNTHFIDIVIQFWFFRAQKLLCSENSTFLTCFNSFSVRNAHFFTFRTESKKCARKNQNWISIIAYICNTLAINMDL